MYLRVSKLRLRNLKRISSLTLRWQTVLWSLLPMMQQARFPKPL
jgi:hypothetical protein